jgi:hypothetical protein
MRSVTAGWAGASHQIDQRSRSADNGDDFTLLRSPHFLAIFMWKRALAKVCCTFCRSHLPKVLRPQVFFLHFEMQSDLLPQSREKNADLASSKSAPNVHFFTIWSENRALADSPVHFSTTTFPDRSAKPRKQRPYFGDPRSHITRQNTGFRAWECFHPCIDTWWHDVDTRITWWWQDCPWTFVRN